MNIASFFEELIVLENKLISLTPLKNSDFDLLVSFSENEPDLWSFGLMSAAGSINLKNYIKHAISKKKDGLEYPFLLTENRSGKAIGSSRFYAIDLVNKSACIGYTWIGKAFQGSPINFNCKYLMLKYLFEELSIERVEFRTDVLNLKSVNALKKIGAIEEGILRSHLVNALGKRRDTMILSIVKDDWFFKLKSVFENDVRLFS